MTSLYSDNGDGSWAEDNEWTVDNGWTVTLDNRWAVSRGQRVSGEPGQWVTEWQLRIWEFNVFIKGTAGITGFLIVRQQGWSELGFDGLNLVHFYYGITTAGGSGCLWRGPECGVGNCGGTLLLGSVLGVLGGRYTWVFWVVFWELRQLELFCNIRKSIGT